MQGIRLRIVRSLKIRITNVYFFGGFMRKIKNLMKYFSKGEFILWCSSITFIIISFCIFDRESYLTLIASLIGVTSLIFSAKGNPFGQFLMIIFSSFYGIISWGYAYYGEMITYLGMTAPMAAFALVAWLKNPYNQNKSEVRVNRVKNKEIFFMLALTAIITFIFYFILRAFYTSNLILSTLSVATSFIAVYLTFRRSAYFALAYASNDVILICLWIMATIEDISYLSVVICFVMFLVNDIYGFYSWLKMGKRQAS